jgi:hypothetical protein
MRPAVPLGGLRAAAEGLPQQAGGLDQIYVWVSGVIAPENPNIYDIVSLPVGGDLVDRYAGE